MFLSSHPTHIRVTFSIGEWEQLSKPTREFLGKLAVLTVSDGPRLKLFLLMPTLRDHLVPEPSCN